MNDRIGFRKQHIDTWNRHWSPANMGRAYAGSAVAGLMNGLAVGFMGDVFQAVDVSGNNLVRTRLVAASAGGDLATPVAYMVEGKNLRVRVGSTNAGGVPATSGIIGVTTTYPAARGVLRMGLADVDAASHMLLDQSGTTPIPVTANWDLSMDIAYMRNTSILATAGYAEFGIGDEAVGVNPAAAIATKFLVFKITANTVSLVSTAGVIASRALDTGNYARTIGFSYDSVSRTVTAYLEGAAFGSYVLPATWTGAEIVGRVAHLAAYAALTDSPLIADIDGILFNCPE